MPTINEKGLFKADTVLSISAGIAGTISSGGSIIAGRTAAAVRIAAGVRFRTIAVPQGSTITSATLTLTKKMANTGTPIPKIYGDNVNDAALWGTTSRVKNITKTTASVNMDVNGSVGVQVGNDVTAIVQEIVNRAGWVSNNNMRFAAFTKAAAGAHNWIGYANSYDFTATTTPVPVQRPYLDITYTSGGGGSIFGRSPLNGMSIFGAKQFNPSLEGI